MSQGGDKKLHIGALSNPYPGHGMCFHPGMEKRFANKEKINATDSTVCADSKTIKSRASGGARGAFFAIGHACVLFPDSGQNLAAKCQTIGALEKVVIFQLLACKLGIHIDHSFAVFRIDEHFGNSAVEYLGRHLGGFA